MKFNIEEQYKKAIGAYKITNLINGKFYIGSTGVSFIRRYKEHLSKFKNNNNVCKKLFNAFKKYGIENFEFTLLEITTKENILSTEQKYLDLGSDYNICKIAGSCLGVKRSEEVKNKQRGSKNHYAKTIIQYTLDGKKIREFNSMIEAAKTYGSNCITLLRNCCKNEKNYFSAYGYRWSYKGKKLKKRKKINIDYTKQKIFIKNDSIYLEFESKYKCYKYLNVSSGSFWWYLKKGFSKKHNLKIGKLI
jgi:hypothetical protein